MHACAHHGALTPQVGGRGDDAWQELGRALYQPQGQDLHKLGLHRLLCNCKDGRGATGLSLAVQAGQLEVAEFLLSQVRAAECHGVLLVLLGATWCYLMPLSAAECC